MAEPSLLLGLPGVKDSSVWSQHVSGSALILSSQPVRGVLPLFFFFFGVGQDIPGDVFELLVELTIIGVTSLESSLYTLLVRLGLSTLSQGASQTTRAPSLFPAYYPGVSTYSVSLYIQCQPCS